MEVLGRPSPVTSTTRLSTNFPKLSPSDRLVFAINPNCSSSFGKNCYSSLFPSFSPKIPPKLRKSVISAAKKKGNKKVDSHSFVPKPDEATGPFPEAVLLKEKKVQEDGRFLPEFADAEEQELFEQLYLELESDLDVELMRHYEVVYLIHEDRVEEVESVNAKVEDFIKEKNGKIWRFSDWGLRKLAYKIQKAKNAHYILMNFELAAKWINDFKNMLDKDERVIRHLVMKKDKAETQDCPPPPEFHSLCAGSDGEEEDDYGDKNEIYNEEDDEGEINMDENGDDGEEGVIYVDDFIEKYSGSEAGKKSSSVNGRGRRKVRPERVRR